MVRLIARRETNSNANLQRRGPGHMFRLERVVEKTARQKVIDSQFSPVRDPARTGPRGKANIRDINIGRLSAVILNARMPARNSGLEDGYCER